MISVGVIPWELPSYDKHEGPITDIQAKENIELNNSKNNNILRPTIVFIHCLNPYGMKHNRRVNEENIDLNR